MALIKQKSRNNQIKSLNNSSDCASLWIMSILDNYLTKIFHNVFSNLLKLNVYAHTMHMYILTIMLHFYTQYKSLCFTERYTSKLLGFSSGIANVFILLRMFASSSLYYYMFNDIVSIICSMFQELYRNFAVILIHVIISNEKDKKIYICLRPMKLMNGMPQLCHIK